MQNIILAIAVFLVTGIGSFAQCDKKVKWQGAKAELIGTSGEVEDTKDATFVITADSKTVSLSILESTEEKIEGSVTESTCEWKETFKNGKAVYKTTLVKPNGDSSPGTVTIEGKDGKITVLVEMEKMEGKKIRVLIDKYETL